MKTKDKKEEYKGFRIKKETWKALMDLKWEYQFSSMDALFKTLINNSKRLREILTE